MAVVEIRFAPKDNTWITNNATLVLADGEPVFRTSDYKYTIGDGVTQLQNLTWYGGVSTTPVWGAITGTLSNQTDLQNALNARIKPRITTITSSATPTINTDNCDAVTITALATAITSMTTNLSGTPNNFDKLTFRIKDNGTARAITWGASFEPKGVALPTTTVISKVLTVGFIYDSVTSKWGCVSSAQEI